MGSATITMFTLLAFILLIATTSNGRSLDSILKVHNEEGNKEIKTSPEETIVKDSRTHFFYASYHDDNTEDRRTIITSTGEESVKVSKSIPNLIIHSSYLEGVTSTGEAYAKDHKFHFFYVSGNKEDKISTPNLIIHGTYKDDDMEGNKFDEKAFMKDFQIHFFNASHDQDANKKEKTSTGEAIVKESKPTPIHFFYGSYQDGNKVTGEAFTKDSKPSPDFIISASYRDGNREGKPIMNHFLYEDKTSTGESFMKTSKLTPDLIVHGSYLDDNKEGKLSSNGETFVKVFKPTPKTLFYSSHQDGEKEESVKSS